MTTYAEVVEMIHQAKVDAQALEKALKKAQEQGAGNAHVTPQPGDKFNPLLLSTDLKVHFDQFNSSMKALDSIRNQGGAGGAGVGN